MSLPFLIMFTVALGLLAGIMAGLLGLGGGTVIVPVLFGLFREMQIAANIAMPMALATTLAVVVITTAGAAISHGRIGNPVWPLIKRYLPWLMLGAFVASQIAGRVNEQWLVWIFPLFLLYVAARLSGLLPLKPREYLPLAIWRQCAFAFFFGNLAIFLGLAGGIFIVPHLVNHHKLSMAQAIGTATVCGTGTAFMGMVGYMLYTAPVHGLPGGSIGYVYWPAVLVIGISGLLTAPLGAHLAKKLPDIIVKRIFAVMLVMIAISMWVGS